MKIAKACEQILVKDRWIRDQYQDRYGEGKPGVAEVHKLDPNLLLNHIVKAKKEWEATADAVSDLILLTDENGIIVRCNRAVQEALHAPYRALIGRSIAEVFYGTAAGIPSVFQGGRQTEQANCEVQFPRLAGWFAVARHPIRTVENDGIQGVVYILTDVTERKRTAEALQQEAQLTAAFARVGRELISTLDPSTILQRLCQLTCEILDCDASHTFLLDSAEQVYRAVAGYGDTPEQRVALSVLSVPKRAMTALLSKLEKEEVGQIRAIPPSGGIAGLLRQSDLSTALCVALRRRGQIIGIQTASYRAWQKEFTPQQERIAKGTAQMASLALENAQLLEETERANRLKSEFLATMSHELRTPLNIVLGYTGLLLEEDFGKLTTEQAECLQRIEKSTGQLLELINTILDVSRLETNQLQIEIAEINIEELSRELQQETERFRREKPELQVVWQVAAGLPPLHTDRTKLKVIITHVFHNAVKFTEHGWVTVEVRARTGGIEICVTDTGIGIAPDVLPGIFEMFRQGERVLTRRYGGVGIGLYVVHRLLALLGGTLSVESQIGQGSTFRIWVPNRWGSGPWLQ